MTRFTNKERERRHAADELADVFETHLRFYTNDYKAENTRNLTSVSYGDIGTQQGVQKDVFLLVPFASGSDYSCGSVERSNYEVLRERWGDWQNERGDNVTVNVYGGHGSYGLLVNLDAATLAQLQAVNETLQELSQYPVVDENHLSELELEWAEESYESWGRYEFRKALCEKYPRLEDVDLDDELVDRLYWAAFRTVGGHWFNDGGSAMYCDPTPEELVEDTDMTTFVEFWALLPSGFDWGHPRSKLVDPRQLRLDLTLYGFSIWAPYIGRPA